MNQTIVWVGVSILGVLALAGGLWLGLYLAAWALYPWAVIFHLFSLGMFPAPEPPTLFPRRKK